jgi:Caspase domain
MRAVGAIASVLWACLFLCQPALAGKRVALVIGNSAYQNVVKLANPASDAEAVAAMFKGIGFDVVEFKRDLKTLEMRRTLRDFSERTRDADIAIIYYAGHGIEIDGTNYVIPVDALLERDIDAYDEALPLDRLLTVIEPAKRLRLVILDACRDNPFTKIMKRTVSKRALGRGLAQVEPAGPNTLIGFAAKAGLTAADGDSRNSPFTAALVKYLPKPGLDVRKAFGFVRDDVLRATNYKQEPFLYGSVGGEEVALVEIPAPPPDSGAEIRRAYELALQVNTPQVWSSFIASYPKGFFTDLAKAQQEKLALAIAADAEMRTAADKAVKAKAAEEVKAAEQARLAAEQKAREAAKAAEVERARQAAEAKAREDARIAAEKTAKAKAAEEARAVEQARIAAEQKAREDAKAAEAERAHQMAEARAREDARIAAEQAAKARAAEEAKAAADKAVADKAAAEKAAAPTQLAALTPPAAGDAPTKPDRPQAADIPRLLQTELRRVGCQTSAVDDKWGTAAQRSLEAFNKSAGTSFDVKVASLDALDFIRTRPARICPLTCGSGFRPNGDDCVRITCEPGYELGDDDRCERIRPATRKPARREAPAVAARPPADSRPAERQTPERGTGERRSGRDTEALWAKCAAEGPHRRRNSPANFNRVNSCVMNGGRI